METNRLGICETLRGVLVLADTNFLIYIASGLIPPSLISEALNARYTILVCREVIEELARLEKSAPKLSTRRLARRAREMLPRLSPLISSCNTGNRSMSIDDMLLDFASRCSGARVVIATCDRGLRRKARRRGIPTLYYRESERVLETDWDILL